MNGEVTQWTEVRQVCIIHISSASCDHTATVNTNNQNGD